MLEAFSAWILSRGLVWHSVTLRSLFEYHNKCPG